jgi:hypothetical protein
MRTGAKLKINSFEGPQPFLRRLHLNSHQQHRPVLHTQMESNMFNLSTFSETARRAICAVMATVIVSACLLVSTAYTHGVFVDAYMATAVN